MRDAYIEPLPRGDHFGPPTSYVLEFLDNQEKYGPFLTKSQAVAMAARLGYRPLVARVRCTNKAAPHHWALAS